MDENDNLTPLTPSEMGKRGAAKRWDRNRRLSLSRPKNPKLNNNSPERLTVRGVAARIQRAIEDRLIGDDIVPWRLHPRLRGKTPEEYIERVWTPKLVKEWEQLLECAKAEGDLMLVRDVLLAMTAMTKLAPQLRQTRGKDAPPRDSALPSHVDLSDVPDETLAQITGKPTLTIVERKKK